MAIERMVQLGVSRIVVNIHHFGEQIIDFINSRKWECEIVISDERKLLLDTGGGLQQAATLFTGEEPIIIHNVDIVSRIDLEEMVQRHLQEDNLATLAVSQRETSRYLLWDAEGQLVGWNNRSCNEYRWVSEPVSEYIPLAFTSHLELANITINQHFCNTTDILRLKTNQATRRPPENDILYRITLRIR